MTNTAVPTIHLNGTSQEALLQEYREAFNAVDTARRALAQITVHMRDYYVQPNGGENFRAAREAHINRLDALKAIHDELLDIALAIQNGGYKEEDR